MRLRPHPENRNRSARGRHCPSSLTLAAACELVGHLHVPSLCPQHRHLTHHPRRRTAQPCVARQPVTSLRPARSQRAPSLCMLAGPPSSATHPLKVCAFVSYEPLPPAASGCRSSATRSSLLGTSSLARGPEPLQSLPSCRRLLPPRQQPVPRLPRLGLLPRHRRRLLRALSHR
jgi:hypothetical protein